MAGKLGKIKCMLKRWHSRSRHGAAAVSSSASPSSRVDEDDASWQAFAADDQASAAGLHAVYVGRSRRRYLVSCDLVDHPLFQQMLKQRSGGSGGGDDAAAAVVGCEVVLFEHLLWMLENADPPPDSIDELVELYTF